MGTGELEKSTIPLSENLGGISHPYVIDLFLSQRIRYAIGPDINVRVSVLLSSRVMLEVFIKLNRPRSSCKNSHELRTVPQNLLNWWEFVG